MICELILSLHFYTSLSAFFCTKLNGFKYFFLSTMNISIYHSSPSCLQSNGSEYWYVSLTIKLNSYLFPHSFDDQTVLFLTIQFSISHLFALNLNVELFFTLEKYYKTFDSP